MPDRDRFKDGIMWILRGAIPAFGALLLLAAAALAQEASLRLTPSPDAAPEPASAPVLRLTPPAPGAPPPQQALAPAPPPSAPAPVTYGPQRISFPGGVTASYAMLGDIQIAEPNALIAFAGARVIENTIREKLPEGFQRAEYLLEHGMIDMVVHRKELKETLAKTIGYLTAAKAA